MSEDLKFNHFTEGSMEISAHVSESIKTKHFTIYHAVQPLELWRNSPQGRS